VGPFELWQWVAVFLVAGAVVVAIGWVGLDTVFIVAAYIAAAAWMSRSRGERKQTRESSDEILAPTGWSEPEAARHGLRFEVARFGVAALVILVAAPFLALSGRGIADATGVGQTFVGALLLAVTTSLPELVASLAAIRIGAYDLAVGNLFGSNAFNMTVLFAADLADLPGPILAAVDPAQVVAGLGAILLMAIALAAVVQGTRTRNRRLEPDAVAVLATYVILPAALWRTAS
jgi:cation:H+ antiporter